MATWKKILREDYAVGTTDGLLDLLVGINSQIATITLSDQRDGASDGEGEESVKLSFSEAFTVGATGTDQIDIDLDADFKVTGDTGNFTVDLNSDSPTFAITASDDYLATHAESNIVDITLDATQWEYTISGTGGSDATHNIGDNITFGSTIGSIDAVLSQEQTSGTITIDLDVAATTVKANGSGSSTFYTGETIDFTSISLTPTVSVSGQAGDRTLTVNLEVNDVTINGDNTSSSTWSASTNADLNLKSASDSGLTVTATDNTWTIDQADVTITGTDGGATQTPVDGITFSSDDGSVTATVGGGDGNAVTVDLEATPKVTTDLNSETVYYMLLQSGGSTTNDETADLNAFIDTGDTGSVGPQYTPSTGTLRVPNLVVDGTSTELNVETVTADDPIIVINNDGDTLASNQGGIELKTSSSSSAHMVYNSVNANLTGWQVSKAGSSQDLHTVAVMDHADGDPSGGGAGSGTFYFDTSSKILYVDVA